MAWYDELQRQSTSAENAVRLYRARGEVDVSRLACHVMSDVLVAHARGDRVVPFEEGRILASLLPAARLLPLESINHILLPDEPAWTDFLDEFHAFLGTADRPPRPQLPAFSNRELTVLELVALGSTTRNRISAGHQRAHGRAPSLEYLRQARCLRKGGTRRGGGQVRTAP